jgi:hypothetical protein
MGGRNAGGAHAARTSAYDEKINIEGHGRPVLA